jgi:hypothetical protein
MGIPKTNNIESRRIYSLVENKEESPDNHTIKFNRIRKVITDKNIKKRRMNHLLL